MSTSLLFLFTAVAFILTVLFSLSRRPLPVLPIPLAAVGILGIAGLITYDRSLDRDLQAPITVVTRDGVRHTAVIVGPDARCPLARDLPGSTMRLGNEQDGFLAGTDIQRVIFDPRPDPGPLRDSGQLLTCPDQGTVLTQRRARG